MTEAHFPTGCRRASKTQSCWGRPRRPELLPENGDCGKFTQPEKAPKRTCSKADFAGCKLRNASFTREQRPSHPNGEGRRWGIRGSSARLGRLLRSDCLGVCAYAWSLRPQSIDNISVDPSCERFVVDRSVVRDDLDWTCDTWSKDQFGKSSFAGWARFNCGVRRCRSNVVARCRRTFTSEVLIPSAAAASLILSSLYFSKQIYFSIDEWHI
jgi:hypothetical protein